MAIQPHSFSIALGSGSKAVGPAWQHNPFKGRPGDMQNIQPTQEEEIKQLKLLTNASTRIHSTLDAQKVLRYMVEHAVELVDASRGGVGLLDGDYVTFGTGYVDGRWQKASLRFASGEGLAGYTFAAEQPYICNTPFEDPQVSSKLVQKLGCYNAVAVPMLAPNGRYFGCFELHNKKAGADFTARDVALLEHLAIYASLALENARLYTAQASAVRALRLSGERYKAMFHNNMAAKLLIKPWSGVIIDANKAARALYGHSKLIGLRVEQLEHQPSILSSSERLSASVLSGDELIHATHRTRDGEVKIVEIGVSQVHVDHNEYYFAVVHDVTTRIMAEQALAESQRMTEIILGSICEGVCRIDLSGTILYVNPAVESLLGFTGEELLGSSALDFLYVQGSAGKRIAAEVEQQIDKVFLHGKPIRYNNARFRCKNGQSLPVEFYASATVSNGKVDGAVLSFVDITERITSEQEIRNLAYTDTLTQLPNRLALQDGLRAIVERSIATGKYGAVVFFDIDSFKTVNDSLGHSVGDQLLQKMAENARHSLGRQDMIARHGGDEFVVACGRLVTSEDAAVVLANRLADDLRVAVSRAYHINDIELHASISIGTATFGGGANSPGVEDVLRRADTAMYEAKRRGRARACAFEPAMQEAAETKLMLEGQLRSAVERGEFHAYFQPKVAIDGDKICGAEVLIRWQHPTRGLIMPGEFIDAAEESGLILDLGDIIFAAVFKLISGWIARDTHCVPIAINLSASQFNQADLVTKLGNLMSAYNVPSRLIELEITETTLMQNPEQVRANMLALRQLGVRISVDDFGTGFSSLNYLKKFPLDTIKIDQAFVRDIQEDPDDRAITSAIVSMARALHLRTVAEGVETNEQLSYLQGIGCDQFQGWLHSKAMPADEFEKLLSS